MPESMAPVFLRVGQRSHNRRAHVGESLGTRLPEKSLQEKYPLFLYYFTTEK